LPRVPGESTYGYTPEAINDHGTIVGFTESPTAQTRAFIYNAGKLTDLNTLISPGLGITLTSAGSINNAGQIAVGGTTGGISHAYLLAPCVTFTVQMSAIHEANTPGNSLNKIVATFTPASCETIPLAAAAALLVSTSNNWLRTALVRARRTRPPRITTHSRRTTTARGLQPG
jgi:probable HAF family extracellular repeat protein